MYRYFEKLALELAEKALTEHQMHQKIGELLVSLSDSPARFGSTPQKQRSLFGIPDNQDDEFRRSFLIGFVYTLVVRFKAVGTENKNDEDVPENSQALVFKSEKLTDANEWIEKNLDVGGGREFEPCADQDAANIGMIYGANVALTNKTLE